MDTFDYDSLKYTDEYYDILGLPYPDGREPGSGGFEFSEVTFGIYKTEE